MRSRRVSQGQHGLASTTIFLCKLLPCFDVSDQRLKLPDLLVYRCQVQVRHGQLGELPLEAGQLLALGAIDLLDQLREPLQEPLRVLGLCEAGL
jgi:hypothetical protein